MSSSALPLFRFGIIADPQYAAVPPHATMDRYYANSLAKLAEAIEVFNGEELSFVMTLGDVIVSEVAARLGMPSPYYSFHRHGWRFIVLDGNEVSTFAPPEEHPHRVLAAKMLAELRARGERNAHPWNGALSDEQFAWLGDEIASAAAAGEKVIVMNHYPVYPAGEHDMWDCDHIVALLAAHDNVVAYLNGHNHAGNYGKVGACHFVNFKGVVDTESENAFAIVDVHPDRIEIRGFGREESRTLAY
ncbi:metallophosphoesterase [Rhizobium ecuadorense]|uniref:metallophosphoesterase n=1 Tax=Rhizobium ecuadorense TaxID=1671795 RepID=UPI0006738418|nr:metallophosphoesterase [Rhizobium ecuadorense]